MSDGNELDSLRGEVTSLNKRVQELFRRVDDAHGEALACSVILTQMLWSIGERDAATLRDCLEITIPNVSATTSPIDRAMVSALKKILDPFQGERT